MPRPSKPKKLKEAAGTLRPSRELCHSMEDSVQVISHIPQAPESLPPRAREIWAAVAANLYNLGILTELDLDMLRAYCYQVHVMEEAERYLNTEGLTVMMKNKTGGSYPMKSPWISIYNQSLVLANRLALQFGLSPSGRAKISTGEKKIENDPWDEI